VLFVTKRILWPSRRSRRTASAPPAIGSPDTWKTPSTSRRMAAMERDSIRVTRSVVVPLGEIELRFSRSSGPGGQHAQKSETRVEAVFDVEASQALTDAQKRRVIARAGPRLTAVAQDERSQLRNRELAVERIAQQLRDALRVERRRVATKPSAASVKRRLEQKRRRSETKRLRRSQDE
jgi:ribosome-associated protein